MRLFLEELNIRHSYTQNTGKQVLSEHSHSCNSHSGQQVEASHVSIRGWMEADGEDVSKGHSHLGCRLLEDDKVLELEGGVHSTACLSS